MTSSVYSAVNSFPVSVRMPDSYPIPWNILPGLAVAAFGRRQRSFRKDSQSATSLLKPPLVIRGLENVPATGPYLLTTNHYGRPGFGAWWLIMALSAALPVEVHWIMTGAWIFPGKIYEAPMRSFSSWLFPRLAGVYGFTNMTPIAPYSTDVAGRAQGVRRTLDYARSTPNPVIGLAPEGKNHPGGVLGAPPPGLGRFVAKLAPLCQVILPAGVFEAGDNLCVQFGEPYRLETPSGLSAEQIEAQVSSTVMHAIARQLPPALRGKFNH